MDMNMEPMIPAWLTVISWIFVVIAVLCAAAILYDILGRGYRQRTSVMEAVWPITALYLGPLALLLYYRWGRPRSEKWRKEHGVSPRRASPPRPGGPPALDFGAFLKGGITLDIP